MKRITKKDSPPEGFLCKCGSYHSFPIWVFAHWEDEIFFTTQCCKIRYRIQRGRATPQREKPRQPKPCGVIVPVKMIVTPAPIITSAQGGIFDDLDNEGYYSALEEVARRKVIPVFNLEEYNRKRKERRHA